MRWYWSFDERATHPDRNFMRVQRVQPRAVCVDVFHKSSGAQEQELSSSAVEAAVKPKAAPAARESAVSRGLRVPTSLRSAAAMALERDEEAAAARRKRVDDQAIVRKVRTSDGPAGGIMPLAC